MLESKQMDYCRFRHGGVKMATPLGNPSRAFLPMPSPSSPQGRVRGFTLIELLAVIAIVGVLALLIFVGTAKVRERLDQSTCASNMRQVGQAVLLYANDNRGRLPPIENLKDANGNYITDTSWINVVPNYYLGGISTTIGKTDTTFRMMRCPEVRKVIVEGTGLSSENQITSIHQLRNFAFNFFLGPNKINENNWRTLASIRNPSRTMMLTEAGIGTNFVCVGVIDTGFITQSTRGPDGLLRKGVHGDFNNIVWADGHVTPWEDISRMVKPPYRPGSTDDLWQGL